MKLDKYSLIWFLLYQRTHAPDISIILDGLECDTIIYCLSYDNCGRVKDKSNIVLARAIYFCITQNQSHTILVSPGTAPKILNTLIYCTTWKLYMDNNLISCPCFLMNLKGLIDILLDWSYHTHLYDNGVKGGIEYDVKTKKLVTVWTSIKNGDGIGQWKKAK